MLISGESSSAPLKPDDMKLTFMLMGVVMFLYFKGISQNLETEWEKQFTLKVPHLFADVIQNGDGGYTVLGAIQMSGSMHYDLWLISFSASGDTLWSRTYSNDGCDAPFRLVSMPGGSFLLAAVNGLPGELQHALVIHAGSDGNEIWRKSSDRALAVSRTDIAVEPDGNWWWMFTPDAAGGTAQVVLQHMDSQGGLLKEYTFSDKLDMKGHALRILPDGSLALTGQQQVEKGGATLWVMRVSNGGETIWKSALPGTGKTVVPECICCSSDNAMLVAGWIGTCMNPDAPPESRIMDYDLIISKIDQSGKLLWSQNYDREGSEGGNAIAVMNDGNILVAGKCETSFTGSIGPWLMIADKSGKLLQDKVDRFRFGGDQASRIINTADGGFLMVGPGRVDPQQSRVAGWIKKFKPLV